MKKKRILSGLLAIFIAVASFAAPDLTYHKSFAYSEESSLFFNSTNDPTDAVIADDPTVSNRKKTGEITDADNFLYYTYSDNTATVIEYSGNKSDIEIPSTVMDNEGKLYTVTKIGDSSFIDKIDIKNVTLPTTILEIGYNAFYNCTQLEGINFPADLKEIGQNAFYNCINLTSVNLNENIETLNYGAFSNCKSITSFNIPAKLKYCGMEVFAGCNNLSTIIVDVNNSTYHSIDGVLYKGNDLIYYPEGKTDVSYTVNSNITFIDYYALKNNPYIATLIISSKISTIQCCFYNCENLGEIRVSDENMNYSSKDGILYSKDMTELIRYPSAKAGSTFNIPDTVVKVSSYAFDGCKNLVSIRFNNNVQTIYGRSFIGCENLKDISFLTDCENSCDIHNWDNMTTSLSSYNGFLNCSSLESINIPSGVTSILYNQFTNCTSLIDVAIPESVITIDNGQRYPYKKTFEDCDLQKTIHGYDGSYAQYYANSKGFDWHSHGQASYIPLLNGIAYDYNENGVALSWNGVFVQTDFAKQFKVYRSDSPTGTPLYIGNTTPKTTYDGFNYCNYCDKDIEYDKTYYYYVTTVIDDTHESDFSNVLSIETPTGINSPKIESVSLFNTRISISWRYIKDAKGYKLYRSKSEACTDPIVTETGNCSYYDTQWEGNTTYYYFVSSVMADGTESALSKPYKFTTPNTSPTLSGIPEILNISYNNGTVFIIWNRNITGSLGSNIYRSETLDVTPTLLSESYEYSSYADNSVVSGKTYYYWVKVIKSDGTLTDFSNYKSITIPSDSPSPSTNTISGTIPNFSKLSGTATIQLLNNSGSVVDTVQSTDGTYSFDNITVGENYKLRVTMPKCVPHEYNVTGASTPVTLNAQLLKYGDSDGDGDVEAKDATQILKFEVGAPNCFVQNGITDEYLVAVAHVLPSGELSAKDATQILRYVAGVKPNVFETLS